MSDRLKKIAKASALLFTIGVALAVAVPLVMGALGATGAVASVSGSAVLSSGLFFAGFGALNEVLNPTFDKMFGTEENEAGKTQVIVIEAPAKPHAVYHSHAVDTSVSDGQTSFSQKIKSEKLALAQKPLDL